MNNLIKETLRLYNSAPGLLIRTVNTNHEIGGIEVKKNDYLINMFLV